MRKSPLYLKIFLTGMFILSIAVVAIIVTSPAHQIQHEQIITGASVMIQAPVHEVYRFMSNSDNARKWSSYIHHITLLEGEDGMAHSKRRCFKNADEKGIQWDEEILFIDSLRPRRLSIYNAKGFPVYVEGLTTVQHYTKTGNTTRLHLALLLPIEHSWWDKIKFYCAAYQVKSIFKSNLQNIKQLIEQA